MADTNIRHTKNGKHYKAPVMLAHRTMMKLGMGAILTMGIMFASGYVVGFKKAENKVNEQIQALESQGVESHRIRPLPALANSDAEKIESQTQLLADSVEIADAGSSEGQQVVEPEAAGRDVNQRTINVAAGAAEKELKLEGETENRQHTEQASSIMVAAGAGGGPVESESGLNTMGQIVIDDNANVETAGYSIQVGMFQLRENAERKVEELIAVDLRAYLVEYTNRQKKLRYKVFFGYFADRKSAVSALVKYEKEMAGSGYVTPLPPSKNAISKSPV